MKNTDTYFNADGNLVARSGRTGAWYGYGSAYEKPNCANTQADNQMERLLSAAKQRAWEVCQDAWYNDKLSKIQAQQAADKKTFNDNAAAVADTIKRQTAPPVVTNNSLTNPAIAAALAAKGKMGIGTKIGISVGVLAIIGATIYFVMKVK